MLAEKSGQTLQQLLTESRSELAEAGIETAALDARLLASEATGLSELELVTRPGWCPPAETVEQFWSMVSRRLHGEPVHRILGYREFYGLRLSMSAETLEPRPDTESLVDLVLPRLRTLEEKNDRCRILDLGTGTGAIALALLSQTNNAFAVATDISSEALRTAGDNARRLGLESRMETVLSDWFEQIEGKFHIIVANPPYIESNEIAALETEVREYDPPRALDGGFDGLEAYRRIAERAGDNLEADGLIAVEIGCNQRRDVRSIFENAGYREIASSTDLGGRDRALLFGS